MNSEIWKVYRVSQANPVGGTLDRLSRFRSSCARSRLARVTDYVPPDQFATSTTENLSRRRDCGRATRGALLSSRSVCLADSSTAKGADNAAAATADVTL